MLKGTVLQDNERMLSLMHELGFSMKCGSDAGVVEVSLRLTNDHSLEVDERLGS